MNWKNATLPQVKHQILQAVATGRGVTVSPVWLAGILKDRAYMAMLAADTPQFDNPLQVYDLQDLRDRIVAEWKELVATNGA